MLPHEATPNTLPVSLSPTDGGLLVRPGCFLKYPDVDLQHRKIPSPRTSTVLRWRKGLLSLVHVRSGDFVLTTPFENARMMALRVKEADAIIVRPEYVVAFSEGMLPRGSWHIDGTGFITGRYYHVHFSGPGTIILFGLGGLISQPLTGGDAQDYARGAAVAWQGGVEMGAGPPRSIWRAILGIEPTWVDRFAGQGLVILQTSPHHRLPRRGWSSQTPSTPRRAAELSTEVIVG